jgi:hypothetical protein
MHSGSKAYIDTLNMIVQERNASLMQQTKRDRLGNLKPLTEQITELMLSLPVTQRDRAWSIVDLQGRLQGRYKDRPSLGNIGEALRALGWTRKRDWTRSGEGRRVWLRWR